MPLDASSRQISLPEFLNPERASASYKNGILEIRIDGTVVNYLGNYEEYLASQGID